MTRSSLRTVEHPRVGRAISLLVGLCAVLPVIRLVGADRITWWVVPLEISTPLAILPTVVLTVLAIVFRHWRTVALGALILGLQIWWLVPQLVPHPAGASGYPVRVLSANIEYNNAKDAGLATQITAAHPDIVVLQELSVANLAQLRASGALDRYAYTIIHPAGGFGTGVWSRWPLASEQTTTVAGVPFLTFQLRAPGGSISIVDVHTLPPIGTTAWKTWRTQLRWVAAQARSLPGPIAVIGDFNATNDLAVFRILLKTGHLTDAHQAAGGWAPTWPANRWWLPPVYRFDHVLLSNGIQAAEQHVGHAYGSDHLPVLTVLRLPLTTTR